MIRGLPVEAPPEEQVSGFKRGFVTHVDTGRVTTAYRRRPVIDTLLDTDQITESEYDALSYYRDQALLADKSPVRSNIDFSVRASGNGPGAAILSALIETGRLERDMGVLWLVARRVAVDDWTLARWCIERFGGRERYGRDGKFVAIVPIREKHHMKFARMDLRMAARRIAR